MAEWQNVGLWPANFPVLRSTCKWPLTSVNRPPQGQPTRLAFPVLRYGCRISVVGRFWFRPPVFVITGRHGHQTRNTQRLGIFQSDLCQPPQHQAASPGVAISGVDGHPAGGVGRDTRDQVTWVWHTVWSGCWLGRKAWRKCRQWTMAHAEFWLQSAICALCRWLSNVNGDSLRVHACTFRPPSSAQFASHYRFRLSARPLLVL